MISYCEGGSYFCMLFWHTNIFSQSVKNYLLLFVIDLTLRNNSAVPGVYELVWFLSHTPVLCFYHDLFPSKARTAQYQFCHQRKLWKWPVWWMELFTYFLWIKQTKDTFLSSYCSLTPVMHAFTHLLKQWISCFLKKKLSAQI